LAAGLALLAGQALAAELNYSPAPVDNPLKGLVPYVSSSGKDRFPQSMEFRYFPVKAVMSGPESFDWSPVEKTLTEVNGRGNQLILRFYLEYPKHGNELPDFLREAGVKVTEWTDDEGSKCFTPDYDDQRLRAAMQAFIAAFGKRYDGDPRIGFITAGMLGKWGEWHNYPREKELWASKEVQREVMDAFADAFPTTKVLLRYPAGPEAYWHADNHGRPFGYHDDSFCWATLDTGKPEDAWFFEPALEAAGAAEKWKRYPLGGEIRPELWTKSFTGNRHERDQGFVQCVERLHVTWLMDTGLFDVRIPMDDERRATALREVGRMGYELHVSRAQWSRGELSLTVENRGVAPFYHDWPVELEAGGKVRKTGWKLSTVLPGEPVTWTAAIPEAKTVRIRVPNPMEGGKPLRFANETQGVEWLVITFE
jgi:hypothetical protein